MANPLSISFLLTIMGIFTTWFTFFLLLSDRYFTRIGNVGIENLILRNRLHGLERFVFTQLLWFIVLLSLIIISPLIASLSAYLFYKPANMIFLNFIGGAYIILTGACVLVFFSAYYLNRIHRSLRHDVRAIGYIRTI